MANNDFSNVNLDNLADVTEADLGNMEQSVDMVDVPVATKSVFDAERGNMEQVPIDYDEDDFNFAMRTQRDGIDKANFMGKTEIGDLTSDVDDYFAMVKQETESAKKQEQQGFMFATVPFGIGISYTLKNTAFGKGIISFGTSALQSLPKGRIRKAETEIEDLRHGYRERKDLSVFEKYFAGDDSVLVDGKLEVPTIQEAIDMTDEEKAERIAELEANITASKALLDKSQNWFKDYELDANAGEFDKFMYSLGNAVASVGYSFGVAAIAKNPKLATAIIAGSFGKLQLEDTYEKAREKGVAPQKAEEMGLSTAAVSGALEAFGFSWLEKAVKASTMFRRIAKGFMTEALQEGTQQAAVEGMESAYGIDIKTWDEIAADALYSAAIGGLTGGATGGVSVAFDRKIAKEQEQAIFNEFVNASMDNMSVEEKSAVLKQEIAKRISNANPELEEETINNLAQDIVERANGSTTKAIMALNQVITKEVNFDTNDFTFDVWLAQVKKNLMKRGYTTEEIEAKAAAIRAKEDVKTGFSQVYERAKEDIEAGNLQRSEAEVEQAATLFAANAVGMHKQYGQGESVIDYYNKLNVRFEKGIENRLQENPQAYGAQPMAQEISWPNYEGIYETDRYKNIRRTAEEVAEKLGLELKTVSINREGGISAYIETPYGDIRISDHDTNYFFGVLNTLDTDPNKIVNIYKDIEEKIKNKEEKEKYFKNIVSQIKNKYTKQQIKEIAKNDVLATIITKPTSGYLSSKFTGKNAEIIEKWRNNDVSILSPFMKDEDNTFAQELLPAQAYDANGKADINTPEFKAWFGDSKVVDEQGKPLKMVHFSNNEFSQFDKSRAGINNNESSIGFWFADREDFAFNNERYPIRYDVYLKMNNPLIIEGSGTETNPWADTDKLDSYAKFKKMFNDLMYQDPQMWDERVYESFYGGSELQKVKLHFSNFSEKKQREIIKGITDKLNAQGYDGIIIKNTRVDSLNPDEGINQYIVFEPNQIKSVYNRGTWSAASDNIYEQTAFAGSRVDYDAPSLEAIGSGEGNQAHGYGLYYALNKGVAENYRESFVYEMQEMPYSEFGGKTLIEYIQENGKQKAKDVIQNKIDEAEIKIQFYQDSEDYHDAQIWQGKLKELQTLLKAADTEGKGQVYEVDLPENPYLLDEQKTLSEQSNFVKDAIQKISEDFGLDTSAYKAKDEFFAKVRKYLGEDGENLIKQIYDLEIETKNSGDIGQNLDKLDDLWYEEGKLENELSKTKDLSDFYINEIYQIIDLETANKTTGDAFYKQLMEVAESKGINTEFEQQKFASELLNKYGIKGITYFGQQDGRCFVIFDPKDVKVIQKFYQDNAGTPQQTGAGRRGEIERTPQGYVIRLFEQADPSTLFHEMWHLFTFQLQEAAKTSERAKADWEVLANWSGYTQAVTPDEKRAALERMARGGEQYLAKGKAPSNRLKFAFENFKQWLLDVYGNIKNLNVEINYEVEKVFNRLIGGKSLDYAFVSEKSELGQELKRMRQKNIDAVVSGRYIISDQTQMREITGIERMKALTQSIIDLTKMNKGKDLLLVMSDNLGDQTIEDIGNLIKTTKMRLPRKGDTLYTKLIKEGGITKELDRQFDITGLMGLERNDKLVRKPTKKEKVIGANGQESIVWSKDKPKPIETEEQLLEFLKKNKLLPELQADYTYADLDAEWEQALQILERAPETYLDNGARKIAEEAVAEANRILEDIFQKPVSQIEEDYENFLEINRDFDIVSKDMLKDIRGLAILIERETNRLQRLVKQSALEEARSVRDDIIGMLERSIPAAQRSAFIKYISEIDTYERLISRLPTLVNRIVFLQEKMFNEKLYRRIENVLKWSKSYKDSSGKRVSKFRDGDVQDFMDEAAKLFLVKNKEKAAEMIEKLLPKDEGVISRENVFKIKMLQVAAKLDGTVAENYLDVYNVLLDTYKAGKFAGEAERELRKEKEQKLAEMAYNIITKINPEEKGFKRDVKQKIKGFFYTQQGWEDLMDILSGGDKKSKEYESDLSNAARVLGAEVAERGKANQWGLDLMKFLSEALGGKDERAVLDYVKGLGKKIDLGTWASERETKWGKKTNVKIEMSKDEMIDFYMKWKDEGSKKAILSKNGNGYSENMANAILNNLTQEDINVAEALFNFYKSTRDEVFEAYRDEFGVSLGQVEWYSPRYREVNGDIESYYQGNIKAVSTGRVKERKDSAAGAINFLGAFKTLDRYIAEVTHYTAWRKKMRDLNVIFGDKDVREAIRERFGNSIIKIIDKQIQDFATNGRQNANAIDNVVNGFRTNFTISALAIKPALTLKQMTSIFAFMEYVPAKDFVKDLAYAMTHFKEIKAILDESPLMKTRFANMQLEVNEMVNKHAIQRFVSSPKLQEAMMVFVQLGDIGAIYTGGWSVYAQAIREGKSKQEALQIFERAANSSQQSSYLSELSEWQRGGSFAKLFTMFASSQNQYFRKEMAAVRNLINGRVDKTTAAKRILIYHFLLPMLFQWVCDLGRWDGKAQLRAALIGSLNGIFLIKDMFDALLRKAQGERVFEQTLSIFNTLNDISETLGKSIKTWLNNPDFEDVCASIKDLGVVSGEAAGLPTGQIENLWEGIVNVYEGNVVEGVEMLAGWTPYAVKNAEGGIPKDIAEAFK